MQNDECRMQNEENANVELPTSNVEVPCAEGSFIAQAGRPGILLRKRADPPLDPGPSGLGYHGSIMKRT
jgi:hypothetical protein